MEEPKKESMKKKLAVARIRRLKENYGIKTEDVMFRGIPITEFTHEQVLDILAIYNNRLLAFIFEGDRFAAGEVLE